MKFDVEGNVIGWKKMTKIQIAVLCFFKLGTNLKKGIILVKLKT